MIYGSVCSGIEAATVAWEPLGWRPAWYSEIEPFPCAILQHHYPKTPNLGDMTKLNKKEIFNDSTLDVLIGGTPCQSFSIAGLRKGLADPRGNLAIVFLDIVDRKRPSWVVWENVPGVLSSNKGRDFGAFFGGLAELGYGVAYRVLDAQFFGVPQRRRRVFVVGYLGDWRPAAAILFERYSLSGNVEPPSRNEDFVPVCVTARGAQSNDDRETYLIEIDGRIRRLMPLEKERQFGFPDGYTDIPWRGKSHSPDGPRYKALGNSMAVPVIRWLGERIQLVCNSYHVGHSKIKGEGK